MYRHAALLFSVTMLALGACVAGDPRRPDNTPIDGQIPTDTQPLTLPLQGTPSATRLSGDPTPDIIITTDRELYVQGENIVIAIENTSDHPVQWMEGCSPNLCIRLGADWICVERECDGPMTILEPGQSVELIETAGSLDDSAEAVSRYTLGYQVVTEVAYLIAHSNAFTVENGAVNCDSAREIALKQAQSSRYWADIDPTRVFVLWQGEDRTCTVDFAWRGAEEIRTGLWSEGYAVTVRARSGRVLEADAYER